jgi:hypothetical protein
MTPRTIDHAVLRQQLLRLRGDQHQPPHASVIMPVNAQADLANVLQIVADIADYRGTRRIEVVLVVNNYPVDQPPPHLADYESLGLRIVGVPNLRKPGEAVGFTGRMHGLRAAQSEYGILFDADCRVGNATALLDWYIDQFDRGAQVAYTHVAYYDTERSVSVGMRVLAHHLTRWAKRTLLGIPTTRGSNYAVLRTPTLALYEQGYLADEMNVGPTTQAKGGRVVYSGAQPLTVYTSGRYLKGGWLRLGRYLIYRFKYNLRVLPVRANAAQHTQRQHNTSFYPLFVDNADGPDAGKKQKNA